MLDYNKIAKELIAYYTVYSSLSIDSLKAIFKISKKDKFNEIEQFLIEYKKVWKAQKEFSGALKEWDELMTEQLEELLKKLNRRLK